MPYSNRQIIQDVDNHIQHNGGGYRTWYVGIAADAEDHLFSDHNVWRKSDACIYREAASSTDARDIEEHFLRLGTDGDEGGGGPGTDEVYAYKKASHTDP